MALPGGHCGGIRAGGPGQRLKGTEWAEARVDTIRLKLFKIGTLVSISVRRVVLQMSSAFPWKEIYAAAYRALRC
jgi:hypothetical protein